MCSSFPGLLIGRTAVHSGKDPAFVAYDQFLSTGILQPLSRGEVRCGSNPIFEVMSAARPLFYRKRKSIGGLAKSFVHGDQRRHRRCFVAGLLCLRSWKWTGVFILTLSKSGNDQLPINDLEHRWPISIIIAVGVDQISIRGC